MLAAGAIVAAVALAALANPRAAVNIALAGGVVWCVWSQLSSTRAIEIR